MKLRKPFNILEITIFSIVLLIFVPIIQHGYTEEIKAESTTKKAQITLDEGLIAYYPFNGNADDESGKRHDGTVYGATLTEDRFGNPNSAYRFDGVDDYIKVPDSEELRLSDTDFTLSIWLFETSRNISYADAIMFKRELNSEKATGWTFSVAGFSNPNCNNVGKLSFDMPENGNSYAMSSGKITLNTFHHVVMVYSKNDETAKIYINGVLEATKIIPPLEPNTNNLFIGKDSPTTSENNKVVDNFYYFHGIIDDIHIYNRTLSESEIQELYGYIHVDAGSIGAEKGTVDAPFKTIQAAINAAKDGDVVIVADGTYTGTDDKNLDFEGKAIIVRSENGPENCIIDCENDGRGFYFHSGEGQDSVVSGFKIINGRNIIGAGIFCEASSSPTIANCIFNNNFSNNNAENDDDIAERGGGMANYYNSNPTVIDCVFTNNGGGILNKNSMPIVTNCTFKDNHAGGMLNHNQSNPIVTNCIFSGNFANTDGAGMYNSGNSNPTVINCTFENNFADGHGGGMFIEDDCHPTVTNSIFWSNSDSYGNHQISGSAAITYSVIQGGYLGGDNNINTDPLFVDALIGDYHLTRNSPCIDNGKSETAPQTDIDGIIRPQGSRYDIGAYEYITDITIPEIITIPANFVTSVSAIAGGKITDDGGSKVIERGVCWNTLPEPTKENNYIAIGDGMGNFVNIIKCLSPCTTYYVKAYATNIKGTSYGKEIKFNTGGSTGKKAIIVAGWSSSKNSWEATMFCADNAYKALEYQGYSSEDIYYLTPDTDLDDFIIDGNATHKNLQCGIKNWAIKADDELLIYIVGNGENGIFRINTEEIVNAEDLGNYLDELQMVIAGKVIFIYDANSSGSFISLMKSPEMKKRIVIAGSGAQENASFLRGGKISFSYQFWSSIYDGASLYDAFNYAKDIMNDYQTPLTDANRDGVCEQSEVELLNNILINKDSPGIQCSVAGKKKAIIVAGGGDHESNFLWDKIQLCADYAYLTLLAQNYSNDDIYYLSPATKLTYDFNGRPLDDVIIDGYATATKLLSVIETCSNDADELLLYLVDHGGPGAFKLNATEILDAQVLDDRLDKLQEKMTGRLIFIYDACQSASFIPLMTPPEGKERIVITSAEDNASFSLRGQLSFSYQFWSSILMGADLNRAFFHAKNIMEDKQTALVDANRNGIAEDIDGKMLSHIVIGSGFGIGSDLPHIKWVNCEPILYDQTSAMLWAGNITDEDDIREVRAIITPPDFDPGSPDEPITHLPSVELTDPDKSGIYQGSYDCFTQKGIYKIAIYAIDAQGFYSLPHEIIVEQTVSYEIGLADAILVLKMLAGIDVNNLCVSDINGDGKIGMGEVSHILQNISGLR